jgi:hypothetical protein
MINFQHFITLSPPALGLWDLFRCGMERFFITFLAASAFRAVYFSRGKTSASVGSNDFNTDLMGRAVRGNMIYRERA